MVDNCALAEAHPRARARARALAPVHCALAEAHARALAPVRHPCCRAVLSNGKMATAVCGAGESSTVFAADGKCFASLVES